MTYIHRVLETTVKRYVSAFSVVGITGPRQSGKSTMLRHILGNSYQYVTFDDHKVVHLFHDDPERFMRIYSDRVIIDEAQKVPEIFDSIKLAVDNDRSRKGKFVVTGSSQFLLMKKVSESLAGRIGLLRLLPFQRSEVPVGLREQSLFRGGYPEPVTQKYGFVSDWYSSYIETYLNRDVRELSNIGDMREFRKCLRLLAARTSGILNMSDLSRDVGMSVSTIKKWVSVLEASYIIFLLPPYFSNVGKRMIKSPKVYFYDTGLISYLTGIDSSREFEHGPMHGAIFENYIVSEIMKRELHTNSQAELFYYRTSHGVEVDLIIDRKRSKEYIEIKSGETFRSEMVKHIEQLKAKNEKGTILFCGKNMPYTDNIEVLNYSEYLKKTV